MVLKKSNVLEVIIVDSSRNISPGNIKTLRLELPHSGSTVRETSVHLFFVKISRGKYKK